MTSSPASSKLKSTTLQDRITKHNHIEQDSNLDTRVSAQQWGRQEWKSDACYSRGRKEPRGPHQPQRGESSSVSELEAVQHSTPEGSGDEVTGS